MVSLAISGLQIDNLGDSSKITPDAIANQVMEDNNIENVTAEGSEFPTNIIFSDDGVKVGVNSNLEVGELGSYDGIYSVSGLEGKIAPEELFDYEIIDDGALAATGLDSLPKKTAKIIRIKPEYCNNLNIFEEGEEVVENTYYEIKYDNDVITKESLLVVPYEVDGKYITGGIEGEKYTITEANIYALGNDSQSSGSSLLPKIETIIFPNTVKKMEGSNGTSNNEILKTVVLSDKLENISDSAFHCCTSLLNIIIPESVVNIGGEAFRKCNSLSTITIPENVKNIGGWAFLDCVSLTSVTYNGSTYTSKTELINALTTNGVTCESNAFDNTGLSN